MSEENKVTKRTFLRTLGAGMPTVKLMFGNSSLEGNPAGANPPESPSSKFTPIDCSRYFNASAAEFGKREEARELGSRSSRDSLLRTPAGKQTFRGIPFLLAPEGGGQKSWIALSNRSASWTVPRVEIPVGKSAAYVCLAQFCDWDKNENPPPSVEAFEQVGQPLAEAVVVFEDGTSQTFPIRRRFEVGSLTVPWGHLCFNATTHRQNVPTKTTDPLRNARMWGDLQLAVWEPNYPIDPSLTWRGTLWLCALENPSPGKVIKALQLEAKAGDPLMICGVTLYHGREHPLRYERLNLFRFTLPKEAKGKWEAGVDLGVVARSYQLPPFEADAWLASPAAGLGESLKPPAGSEYLYAEIAASPGATLTLREPKSGMQYEFELDQVLPGREVEGRAPGARVQILERDKTWLHAKTVDKATGKPTPVRIAFRSKEGRYIPPYGHRTEVNSGWFQDYGADLQREDSFFAYVDGTFQVELPVGEVYVEVTKGFEYEPVRRKLKIEPGQRELTLEMSRFLDFRSKNWVSADSHVHFLSPATAVLEAQAEGVNLVNILAASWGDLFTNVGDLSHGPLTSSDGDNIIWVGSENRQHLLGHLGLLGVHGAPVFPLGAAGPEESYIGTPLWNNLAEWADACRQREGLVVAVHFPYPTAEVAADIVMGKIDAVELWPVSMGEQFNSLRFLDWYRYLNCGYRLPAVAGTDKMGAWIAVGSYRGYAYLGQDEFNFPNWAKAVRKGNTFMSSGPLLQFQADGCVPGEEIQLGSGGGRIEVQADARSAVPIHRLEVVLNGSVVASKEASAGAREISLRETIQVSGPGWLAARCSSKLMSAGARIAAHTSPVYLNVPGRELFSAPAAAYMLTLIEGAETWAKTLATRPDAERFARAIKIFSDAREKLHQRMHQQGVEH